VVLVIALILTGVAFSVYRLNASYYLREDAYLQQYQNLRVALFTVARDVRMAGNGFSLLGPDLKLIQAYTPTREIPSGGPPSAINAVSDWFHHSDSISGTSGVRAIFGVNGGANYPDTVTIFRAEVESGNPLAKVKGISGNDIQLDSDVPQEAIKSGDIIALGSGTQAIILQTDAINFSGGKTSTLPIKAEGRFTTNSPFFPTGFNLEGAYVYNFREVRFVTYWVDEANSQLMADYHDNSMTHFDDNARRSQVVAYNIEDLQVYYFYDLESVDTSRITDVPLISSARLNDNKVKAVTIGLAARSSYGTGPKNRRRPKLFDRDQGALDNNIHNTLVETIYLRNYHI
jgi:hypothetical protein